MKRTFVFQCLLAIAFLMLVRTGIAQDNLLVIERNLAEQYSSLRSAEVQFRVVGLAPAEGPIPQERLDEAAHWEWLLDGPKKLIRSDPRRITDGQLFLEWYSFDGAKAYEASCYQADGSKLEMIRIRSAINQNYLDRAVPSWMLGLHVGGCDSNTLDWLKRRTPDTVQDLGIERVREHDCRKVQFDNVPVGGKFLTRAIVWFDSDADWLPRRAEWTPRRLAERANNSPKDNKPTPLTLAPGETIGRLEVTEYFKVEDPLLGRARWFPKRAQATLGNAATVFLIDKVVLNQAIDGSRFVPNPVPGTQIDDQTSRQSPLVLYGGEEGLALRQSMLRSAELIHLKNTGISVPTSPSQSPTSAPLPDARPRRGNWWWPVVGSATLLAAVLWFKKRQASNT